MSKRIVSLLLAALLSLSLCGCGSLFDKEYVVESDYAPPAPEPGTIVKITVRNIAELKSVLLDLVGEGETESVIVFDTAYEGDVLEDMSSACWQVRTQDALCAYCVNNISYELNKIVTYYEARITISYSEAMDEADSIVRLSYSTGVEDLIRGAMEEGRSRLVVLIDRSRYSAENMESLAAQVYREYPTSAPREPRVTVNMLSGSGTQRLYEINFSYGMSAAELETRRAELLALQPFAELDTEPMDEAERALAACRYLSEHCAYAESGTENSVYDALIGGQSGSEGMALAYVELCRQLELSCMIVYGQRNWENYCWNIVKIGEDYYHVDTAVCAAEGLPAGFLLRDETLWGSYRWDMSAYPRCTGDLSFLSVTEQYHEV